MKGIYKITATAALALASVSCSDLIEPAFEPSHDKDTATEFPNYTDQILYNAYILVPTYGSPESDVATDDAVSNDITNSYLKLATGSWNANNGTASMWKSARGAIQYINIVLELVDNTTFSANENVNAMFRDRLKGEAYGLRALFNYYLVRQHGGWADGELLGIPLVLASEDASSDFNQPRNTVKECIDQILTDAKAATDILPMDFLDVSSVNEIPEKYRSKGVSTDQYNRVFGTDFSGRLSGRIAYVVATQASLLAASPAFAESKACTWADAANYAAIVIDANNGVNGLAPHGNLWYTKSEMASNTSGLNNAEIIWRDNIDSNNSLEKDNFPPSLRGTGRVNPTQNLVDAFPMANGYPINAQEGKYDAANPYANRDPRLADYIVTNGSTWGHNDSEIITGTFGTNNDVLDKEQGYSTRTGYYMRKLMRPDCNVDPSVNSPQDHVKVRMRYTEVYLDYAEAANEAWGPRQAPGHNYNAYDVIKAIRKRAGLGVDGVDPYLESISNDQDAMRELIRNERRLELCFENTRFWDLRRWKAPINETARGMRITGTASAPQYEVFDVETRNYRDYMYYGPIPYGECVKFSNLKQNDGWK